MTRKEPFMDHPHLEVNFIGDQDACSVQVTCKTDNQRITAVGHSKRHENDRPDPDVAQSLAMGRALRQLGRKLIHHGYDKVADEDRRRREIEKRLEQKRKRSAQVKKKILKELR